MTRPDLEDRPQLHLELPPPPPPERDEDDEEEREPEVDCYVDFYV